MRLDRFINDITGLGRNAVKKEIKNGKVYVNGAAARSGDMKIAPERDVVVWEDRTLQYAVHYYYLMNKPAGVVSATRDAKEHTVIDLLQGDVPDHVKKKLFPVGRLDKDTEGLLLLTDDGALAHRLLSPAQHIGKTYYCRLEHPIEDADMKLLENGVDIGERHLTQPALAKRLSDDEIELTITEGKYHQVKRMLAATGNKVTFLKRIRMGNISLPKDLEPGAYCVLTEEEMKQINT